MDGQTDSILGRDSEDKASLKWWGEGNFYVLKAGKVLCHMTNGQSIVRSYSQAVSTSC